MDRHDDSTPLTTLEDGPGTGPARGAVDRLAGRFAGAVALRLAEAADGADTFTLSTERDRVLIAGSSQVALVSGFNWYLQHCAHGHVSRTGDHIPDQAPRPAAPTTRTSPYQDRYAYNFTVNGYTSPYWTWPEWERELDLIAASGVTMALVTTGLEQVWLDTFVRFGYEREELRRWLSSLSLQPWQWMGNISGVGPAPTRHQLDRRVELGRRILSRMRELGITPVLPGYAGLVPDCFAERNPSAHVVPQGMWGPFDRPGWLATDTELYGSVAAAYYRAQRELFGTEPCQAVDLLHEGGAPGDTDIAAASAGVRDALRAAFGDDHRWVIQAWGENPRPETLAAADRSHLLVLDLGTEHKEKWKEGEAFSGADWALGTLANVGDRNGLFGDVGDLLRRVPAARQDPAAGNLTGLALMLEGVQNQSLIQTALSDLVWESEPVDADDWIAGYVTARYGEAEPHALRAWRLLLASAYGSWEDWPSGADSLFNANPSLTATQASPFAPKSLTYDPAEVRRALEELCAAAPRLGGVETFRYDLVDTARQVLVNRARVLLPQLERAFTAEESDTFATLAAAFLDTLRLTDSVLATHEAFRLEPWLRQAERWGTTADERAALRADAARLVTVWGDRPSPDWVENYANRDWSGLLKTLYLPRWQTYLDALTEALRTGEAAPDSDWYAMSAAWAANPPAGGAAAEGDPIEAARRVVAEASRW
ncbi:alpha-N-acetylglucosaminidase TIM-barrel domain-containing protein [Streptomyces pathocidini]|uniref:Alpha-N-acetylglucosaminidase TIM-barrel domain-containing protein n=1 Tax=Streptomyces pathocidini TaxID=1650571 RepID=A0ABW7URE2_9ACTN|nr:alpha-N-acetylglucosaminidase TIM-barrel domain-containing protein [Streptomyces pathocidini]